MNYPTLTPENTNRDFIDVFGGYNHNYRINENEFFDMKNMTSSCFPLLASRQKRGTATGDNTYNGIQGMIYSSALYCVCYDTGSITVYKYIRGQKQLYHTFNGITKQTYMHLVLMGSYLLIFPYKLYLNLKDTSDSGSIEADVTTAVDETITLLPCNDDGSNIYIKYTATPGTSDILDDGDIWLDSTTYPPALKKYYSSNSSWMPVNTNHIRLTAENTDIGDGFKDGDHVKVSGIEDYSLEAINDYCTVKNIPDSKSIVLSGTFDTASYLHMIYSGKLLPPTAEQEFYLVQQSSDIRVKVYCDSLVIENQYKNRGFSIGGQTFVCIGNTEASNKDNVWIHDTSKNADLTTKSNTAVSMPYKQYAGNNIYIKLADDEDIIGGIHNIQIGNSKRRYRVVFDKKTSSSQYGWISKITFDPLYGTPDFDIEADTPIYPVKYTDSGHEDIYTTTLIFSKNITTNVNSDIWLRKIISGSQSAPIRITRKMPEAMKLKMVIESKNRLWGCGFGRNEKGEYVNEIYASKLGDFKNWECFEGLSTDSYAASCGTSGNWTGAINYLGSPVFFKENYIHTVSGSFPAQYQISNIVARGVHEDCERSLAIIDETLYYMSNEGVCAYNGGLPIKVSDAFGETAAYSWFDEAIACGYKGKYYLNFRDDDSNRVMMVYDTKRGVWHKEDGIELIDICAIDNDVFFIEAEEDVLKSLFGTGTQDSNPVDWFVETGKFGLSQPDSKYISKINIRLSLEKSSKMFASIQYDSSGVWEKLCSIFSGNISPFTLPIKPKRCDHFQLKLEGKGGVKIYSIAKTIEQGSDR